MTAKKKILLVEDEPHLAFNIEFNLQAEGYEVIPAATGQVALSKYRQFGPFDLIILDIMIPEISGIEVARVIRETDKVTGILMLTAMSQVDDILAGLEAGADDYVTKPFQLKELLLRINRMAERSSFFPKPSGNQAAMIKTEWFTLDIDALVLTTQSAVHQVTILESKLLAEFFNHPGQVLTRDHLLKKVWGLAGSVETRTVDNFILRLRKLLELNPSKPHYLKSVRGRGYRFEEPRNRT